MGMPYICTMPIWHRGNFIIMVPQCHCWDSTQSFGY